MAKLTNPEGVSLRYQHFLFTWQTKRKVNVKGGVLFSPQLFAIFFFFVLPHPKLTIFKGVNYCCCCCYCIWSSAGAAVIAAVLLWAGSVSDDECFNYYKLLLLLALLLFGWQLTLNSGMMLTSIAGITGGSGSHSRSSGATTAVFLIKIFWQHSCYCWYWLCVRACVHVSVC